MKSATSIISQIRLSAKIKRILYTTAMLPAFVLLSSLLIHGSLKHQLAFIGLCSCIGYVVSRDIMRWQNRKLSSALRAEGGTVCSCEGGGCKFEKSEKGEIVICASAAMIMRARRKIAALN